MYKSVFSLDLNCSRDSMAAPVEDCFTKRLKVTNRVCLLWGAWNGDAVLMSRSQHSNQLSTAAVIGSQMLCIYWFSKASKGIVGLGSDWMGYITAHKKTVHWGNCLCCGYDRHKNNIKSEVWIIPINIISRKNSILNSLFYINKCWL